IGTASPGSKLDISLDPSSTDYLQISDSTDSDNERARFGASPNGGYFQLFDTSESSEVLIRSYATGGVQAYFTAGNVGIGTANPSEILDIGLSGGRIYFSGSSGGNGEGI